MTIVVDTREQRPFSECDAWKDVEIVNEKLDTADYSNGEILVERKSVNDFINCCGKNKKRFMKELDRGFDILIIEGNINDMQRHLKKRRSRMHINYIISMLKKIRKDYGIEVVMGDSRESAAQFTLHSLLPAGTKTFC